MEIKVDKIVLNRGGVRALLKSDEVMSELKKHAKGPVKKSFRGFDRCVVVVKDGSNDYREEN